MRFLNWSIDYQKKCAKRDGYDDLELWRDAMKKKIEARKRKEAEEKARKPTKAEIAEKIHHLRTNKYAIGFYQRVSDNYDLTAEEVIANLEKVETVD